MRFGGAADLPLHSGHVPPWLIERMKSLASAILKVMLDSGYDSREVLRRLGDPFWFQAFGCVLGFDWNSSGLTTVVTGALREALSLETHGVAVVGGKGSMAVMVPEVLRRIDLPPRTVGELVKASRLSAKVDNALLQDGYTLYHHTIIFDEDGTWTVIQQGMNPSTRYARRYHWVGENVVSFVEEPHSGIVGDRAEKVVLNLVSRDSREVRKASLDLVSESPSRLIRTLNLTLENQETLTRWTEQHEEPSIPPHLRLPRRVNWSALKRAYELRPKNFEELIAIEGMGASTIRALALVAALIYGVKLDWRDPIKFTFAHGGKDGVPYPVSRKQIDKTIEFLRSLIESSEIEKREKIAALQRLLLLERKMFG